MKPPVFDYRAPKSVEEAVASLAGDPDAMVLAGGQSLIPAMNFRLSNPSLLVDLQHIPNLRNVTIENGQIVVGAMVRHRELELDKEVARANPLIPETLAHVAHIPIRNRGTVVGSLCHADAAAEMPLLLVLLGGSVRVQGSQGQRQIAADDFFQFHMTTSRRHDEIVLAACFPTLPADAGGAFDEFTRRHGDYAIAGVGAVVRLASDGKARDVRLAACGIAARPIRLGEAEARLISSRLGESDLAASAAAAAEAVTAADDMHATTAYRRRLVGTLVRRLVAKAAARARERIAR